MCMHWMTKGPHDSWYPWKRNQNWLFAGQTHWVEDAALSVCGAKCWLSAFQTFALQCNLPRWGTTSTGWIPALSLLFFGIQALANYWPINGHGSPLVIKRPQAKSVSTSIMKVHFWLWFQKKETAWLFLTLLCWLGNIDMTVLFSTRHWSPCSDKERQPIEGCP